MKNNENRLLISAAMAGILAASSLGVSSTALAGGTLTDKGHCIGANACKGKGGCAQKEMNACKGKNGCKGKGFLETTRAECEELAKKDKNVRFEEVKKKKM